MAKGRKPRNRAKRQKAAAAADSAEETLAGERFERLLRAGAFAEAQAALARCPRAELTAATWNECGNRFKAAGCFDAAILCYFHAHGIEPTNPVPLVNLGIACKQAGRLREAVDYAEEGARRMPTSAEAWEGLGNALGAVGDCERAEEVFERALACEARASIHYNRGVMRLAARRYAGAAACFEQALALEPTLFPAAGNLALAHLRSGRLYEAEARLAELTRHAPEQLELHCNRARALVELGRIDKALAIYREIIAHPAVTSRAWSDYLLALHYDQGAMSTEIFAEHRAWAERFAIPSAQPVPRGNRPDPGRRLRLGYVSPDFRRHSVAFFLENVLARHDRQRFDVTLYRSGGEEDETTARLRAAADGWRDIERIDDDAAAEAIRADGIDILIDLAGHTAGGRLPLFARKPAPVQMTWLGYPDTTGLRNMDCRLTDAVADPPGATETRHSETLLRLPQGFLRYTPPVEAPEVRASPCTDRGGVTFGSFNAWPKVSAPCLELWAAILREVPASRLLLKSKSLRDEQLRQEIRARFAALGIAHERVELVGFVDSFARHLALYHRIDIALDTFPYNGTTTTCEALWMGCPVVTLAGETHVQRVGASLLGQAGLPEMIATTPEAYRQCALDLAREPERLRQLREGMRERLRNSPLLDASSFARNLEESFRGMWRRYCVGAERRG